MVTLVRADVANPRGPWPPLWIRQAGEPEPAAGDGDGDEQRQLQLAGLPAFFPIWVWGKN